MRLAFLNICYIDYLKSIQHSNIEEAKFENAALNPVLSPLELMSILRKHYKELGMEKEIEGMLDSLREFNKDIENFLFPEIQLYKWDFKYGVDDLRKLLEICENNPTQTAYNYYRTEGYH